MRIPCVIVADDHSVVLAGIRSLLSGFCDVIETVGDGRALVEAALRWRPELIVLDVSMPLLNGVDAARQIKKVWPEAKLLFLSMHDSPVYLHEALSAGGSGYLLKSSAAEELRTAIETVLRGETYLTPAFGRDVLLSLLTPSGRPPRASAQLTDRQRQVLQLIAEGRSNKEIASLLRVSVKTIEFHRTRIMTKLGVHTAAELATFAMREGIVG
jgi:DNA-binding NarL/FixJ family response regulator